MYIIKKTNGNTLVELKESSGINSNVVSNIGLISKLTSEYGQCQSENFVHLAENFANDKFPEHPLTGQTVFNTTDNCMYVCIDQLNKKWVKILSIIFEPPVDSKTGDIYFDKKEKKLFVFDEESVNDENKGWILIGPSNYKNKKTYSAVIVSDSQSNTGHFSDIIIEPDTANLVTIKVVANEFMNPDTHPDYCIRMPECASWVYKLLVKSHALEIGGIKTHKTEIIGEPNYELIGRTNGQALNWSVTPEIIDNKLSISVNGIGTDNPLITSDMDKVQWAIDIEIVKV